MSTTNKVLLSLCTELGFAQTLYSINITFTDFPNIKYLVHRTTRSSFLSDYKGIGQLISGKRTTVIINEHELYIFKDGYLQVPQNNLVITSKDIEVSQELLDFFRDLTWEHYFEAPFPVHHIENKIITSDTPDLLEGL